MEKDFKEFVARRCEKALEDNELYMQDEMSGEVDHDELDARAQVLCYLQGMRDFLQFMGVENTDLISIVGSHGSQER